MKKWLMAIALLAIACGGSNRDTTFSPTGGDEVTSSMGQSSTPPDKPVASEPNLIAWIDKTNETCVVRNNTGVLQNIRFRVYKVNDLSDPANVSKQTKVWDRTDQVGAGETVLRHDALLCYGLYQLDCGRPNGLLAYGFVDRGDVPCPEPTPTPTPTPQPTPTPTPTPTPSPTPPPCVEEWVEQEPIITYGEWGKCESLQGVVQSCAQTRTKTTVINEKNSCTGEVREKSRKVETESQSCECPIVCDVAEFWSQSVETNKNWIKGNVHVRGEGAWVLKLFATSSSTEYPDAPDYTKDTDSKTIGCKGEGELKVEYDWKNHQSKYWWIALYRNNQRIWLGERIEK